jgi:addiction module RelE/StbE family toxin
MMRIDLHRDFKKQYRKLRVQNRKRFDERLVLFVRNPFDPVLNNHALKGKYKNCRSINITGDLRAIYETVGENAVLFVAIDTHSNLYG